MSQSIESSKHLCHALGCTKPVPPRLLMCARHWYMLPTDIQRLVWKHYRPGQEITKTPTLEYLKVMKLAIHTVAEKEELLKNK